MTGEEICDALIEKIDPTKRLRPTHCNPRVGILSFAVHNMLECTLPMAHASKLLAHFEELLEKDWRLIKPQLEKLYDMPLYRRYSNVLYKVPNRAWEDFEECRFQGCGKLVVRGTLGLHNKACHDTGEAPTKPKKPTFGWYECLTAMTQHYGADMNSPGVIYGPTKAVAFTEPVMKLVGRAGAAMHYLPTVSIVVGHDKYADTMATWVQYRKELFGVMSVFNIAGVWKKIRPHITKGEYDTALIMGLAYITFT